MKIYEVSSLIAFVLCKASFTSLTRRIAFLDGCKSRVEGRKTDQLGAPHPSKRAKWRFIFRTAPHGRV